MNLDTQVRFSGIKRGSAGATGPPQRIPSTQNISPGKQSAPRLLPRPVKQLNVSDAREQSRDYEDQPQQAPASDAKSTMMTKNSNQSEIIGKSMKLDPNNPVVQKGQQRLEQFRKPTAAIRSHRRQPDEDQSNGESFPNKNKNLDQLQKAASQATPGAFGSSNRVRMQTLELAAFSRKEDIRDKYML